MKMGGAMLMPVDLGGVCPLLFMVSGWAAMERSSELIEPLDLIKAIYIADLEHVLAYWDDWEGLERFVIGNSGKYINRILYLHEIASAMKQTEGLTMLGRPSSAYQGIVSAARELATGRTGSPNTPSSRDLLFCICSQDPELSSALQKSGLQLEKLAAAVGKTRL